MKLRLYFDTVRHLKPEQVVGRLTWPLRRPGVDRSPAPPCRQCEIAHVLPARRACTQTGPRRFTLLNETGEVKSAGDWNDPQREKLWLYHLHYFDDLNAEGASRRRDWHRALIADWIGDNPPGKGCGWEPYPTSLRIVNWIKWMVRHRDLVEAEWLESLAVQARWLARRIEWRIGANHLFVNGKALVHVGAFLDGPEARGWLGRGLEILDREVPEQILADGGQFERSPMYHALALEDMLDLVNVCRTWPRAFGATGSRARSWSEMAARMFRWLTCMCHPDGEISFFNDAAFAVAPTPAELDAYAGRLGIGHEECRERMVVLSPSGYVRMAHSDSVVLIDAAPVGPDYQPGHAHADTLSFEWSLDGHRLVVNSGTSVYGTGEERQRQRGTAAHSTVTVDGEDSSEVWSGFRVARRARPFGFEALDKADAIEVECSHDGYRRLAGSPVHTRRWRLEDGNLRVIDTVTAGAGRAVAHFPLHPEVRVSAQPDGGVVLAADGMRAVHMRSDGGTIRVVEGTWHPRFGVSLPSRHVEVALEGETCDTSFTWH